MRPLSEAVGRVTGKNFSRKFVSIGRIVTKWDEIMGAKLADKAQPLKIHYRKAEGKKKGSAILDIACSSADATLLHYQKDLILERMNQIFGERWITDLRFVHISANAKAPKAQKQRKPLTAEEKHTLCDMLVDVSDEQTKAKLERLGQAIMEDQGNYKQ